MNRETFFKSAKFKTAKVEVPGWDEPLTIREFSASQINALGKIEMEFQGKEDGDKFAIARALIASAVDESGNHFLTEDDLQAVVDLGFSALQFVNKAIRDLNGLNDDTAKN